MGQIILPYQEAHRLLHEADVLLFRAQNPIGLAIAAYGHGIHSHVGLAHKEGTDWFCVEEREFKGGRKVDLKGEAVKFPNKIDVFRVSQKVSLPYLNTWNPYTALVIGGTQDANAPEVTIRQKTFSPEIAKQIIDDALKIVGKPYSWWTIWRMALGYLPIGRLVPENVKDDNGIDYYVCSTLVSALYREHFIDLVPFLNDYRVQPTDLARSALLNYLFTIGEV